MPTQPQGTALDHPALRLFDAGYRDLIPIVPPDAPLSPMSRLRPDQLGKVPGDLGPHGWRGLVAWEDISYTREQIERHVRSRAGFGLRTRHFPTLDVDVLDEDVALAVEETIVRTIGVGPKRVGRAPKFAMPYRSDQPFTKMRLALRGEDGSDCGMIEVLGDGQQFVVEGLHPKTRQPYAWFLNGTRGGAELLAAVNPGALPLLTVDLVTERLLPALSERLSTLGLKVSLAASGATCKGNPPDQASLLAPSPELLRQAVAVLPNQATYDEYLNLGRAIRGAIGEEHSQEGFEIWADWCARSERVPDQPDYNREKWDSLRPPHRLGWNFISDQAREHGFNSAQLDFEADPSFKPDPLPPPPPDIGYTDMGNGGRFARRYRHEVRFVPGRGWLCYDGKRWASDHGAGIMLRAKQVVREMKREAATIKDGDLLKALEAHVRRSQSDVRLRAMLAQAQPELTVPLEALDANPMLFNVLNGTIDLRTGALLPHDPEQLITKLSPVWYEPGSEAPRWQAFLHRVFAGDAETIAFFQRAVGYSLTGDTSEQVFFVAHGSGQNGKSVAFGAIERVLADYAFDADFSTFVPRRTTGPRNDIAAMVGARFVAAIESEAGERLDESVVKRLTGGDAITARFMYKEFFTFKPQAKIWLVSNYKPTIRGTDFAMWRRVRLIPFAVTIPEEERDPNLLKAFEAELPGILGWMVEGVLAWQREGLGMAPAVRDATEGFRAEADTIARFLREVGSPGTELEFAL